jgi:hypothetical protein
MQYEVINVFLPISLSVIQILVEFYVKSLFINLANFIFRNIEQSKRSTLHSPQTDISMYPINNTIDLL